MQPEFSPTRFSNSRSTGLPKTEGFKTKLEEKNFAGGLFVSPGSEKKNPGSLWIYWESLSLERLSSGIWFESTRRTALLLTNRKAGKFVSNSASFQDFFLSFFSFFFGYTVYSWTLTLSSCSVYRSLFGNVFSGPSHHFTNFPFVFSEPLAMTHFPFKLKTFSLFSTSPFVFWGKKRERNSHA